MKVLIVDDSKTMRRLLTSCMQPLGFETIEAEDGVRGLEELHRHAPIDLALVDWDMPNLNGLQFVQAVRADREFDGMKMMMVTAHNSMEDIAVALERGANDFLMKPVDGEMVAEKIRMLGLLN